MRKYKALYAETKSMLAEAISIAKEMKRNNSRQAQEIIELESVAIALYDKLWHLVYSVDDELKGMGVTNLSAYKTIKALFEAEGETE